MMSYCARQSIQLTSAESYLSASPVRVLAATLAASETDSQHTQNLKCKDGPLLTRRGCSIILQITLSNSVTCPYSVTLSFTPVHGPRERSSTFRASGHGKNLPSMWLSIDLPPSFPVGYYDAHISLSIHGCTEVVTHMMHYAIVVLFNPWIKDDDTYMEDEEMLKCYCLDDVGVMWRGTYNHPTPRLWEYGQFEPQCLDMALMLLKDLSADERRDPSKVTKGVLSKITLKDNTGILMCCYSGRYGGGVHPCKWNGSSPIIQKYHRTRSPVKFGQCWIACGIAVSLLRSLGIPCRPVTCYEAAFPSMSVRGSKRFSQIHRYFTTEGDPVHELETDRIWSYHVVCECWMRRNDLPFGYDGWQVITATAGRREESCIGPVPVKAIKERQSAKVWGKDILIFLAMIHSEIHYHRVVHSYANMSNQQCTLAKVVTEQTGLMIATSDPSDKHKFIDITENYKLAPTTTTATTTTTHSPHSMYPYPLPSKDCSIQVNCSEGEIVKDFTVTVTLSNNGPMVRTVDGRVVVMATQYNGDCPVPIHYMQFSGKITPNRNATVELPVSGKQCSRHTTEQNVLKLFILAKMRETHQMFIINRYHVLKPPELSVQVKNGGDVSVGDNVRLSITFTNTLPSSLTHTIFIVQGLGTCKEIPYRRILLPGRHATVEAPLVASRPGEHQIIVAMCSDKIQDVLGSVTIRIKQKDEKMKIME